MEELTLTSTAFNNDEDIPAKYTADGVNISPPLQIDGVSEEAKSLALIVDDPDAATDPKGPGKTFDHWVLFNIPVQIKEIAENSVPTGATQGKNGMGESKYIGPAPPTGTHSYIFTLFELKDNVGLGLGATKEDVLLAIEPLVINKAQLIGKYQRPQN